MTKDEFDEYAKNFQGKLVRNKFDNTVYRVEIVQGISFGKSEDINAVNLVCYNKFKGTVIDCEYSFTLVPEGELTEAIYG